MAGPEELLQALSALSVEAVSPGDAVTATVNTDGVLTGLKLSAAVRNLPPDELAALVLRTYAEAQRESANRTAALLAPLGTRGYVMDRLKWRAGFAPEPPAAPRRPARPVDPEPPKPVAAQSKPAAPVVPVVSGEGDYLRNRSADPEHPAEPDRPVSDEDWYEAGVRFDEAW
ncbi:YbaB/EbfC family nucleoid-associated protein [Amycolatopsis silviterrae]|uniref:YbaB/EbfC family nucleoid-associated protein n=1 Tax=Amycolatopsis silviterrae TaxID=1656914 RepID=A0ABW5HI81_9PSEU